jgi:hypothetical protein
MSDVTGAFKSSVPRERQKKLLADMACKPGVRAAGLTKEDAKSADLRLLFYVRVDDDQAAAVVEDLLKHADIAAAELEPRRGLA